MPDEEKSEEVTKQMFRRRIWREMRKSGLGNYPSSGYKGIPNIPNFKGVEEATKRLSDLAEFKSAKVIKVNPDRPQESVRVTALEAGKEILMPMARLKKGLFLQVAPPEDKEVDMKVFMSEEELLKHGKPLGIDDNVKVDLVVMGAVCVSRLGHRIGKAEGFADLEFAMLMRMGAITQDTLVVTTVHDNQIVDDLPATLFQKHDVPVDVIVTPTQVIVVSEKLKKPEGIFWDILTMKRVKSIQMLQQLKEMEEKEGKVIVLKTDEPRDHQRRNRVSRDLRKKLKEKKHTKSNSEDNKGKQEGEEEEENEEKKSRTGRRRRTRPRKLDKTDSPENENPEKTGEKAQDRRRRYHRYKSKSDIDFSLKLSNIGGDVRVRDVKNALIERGVRPTEITWRGQHGFCLLHFGKLRSKKSVPDEPVQVDSIVANLQELRIGEPGKDVDNEFIVVEPAEPITRIEITDVTAV